MPQVKQAPELSEKQMKEAYSNMLPRQDWPQKGRMIGCRYRPGGNNKSIPYGKTEMRAFNLTR